LKKFVFIFIALFFTVHCYCQENVYSISMLGQKIGTSTEKWSVIQHKDGRCFIKLETGAEMKISRGPSVMTVSSETTAVVECKTFKPVSITTETSELGTPTKSTGIVKDDTFHAEIVKNNNKESLKYKLDKKLTFFSMLLKKHSLDELVKGFEETVISEESLNKVKVKISGTKKNEEYIINVNYSGVPINFYIKDGVVIKSELQNGLITYNLIKSSQMQSRKIPVINKNESAQKDILELTTIKNKGINIKKPRKPRKTVFSIKGKNIPDIITTCYQKVKNTENGKTIEVDLFATPCSEGKIEKNDLLPNIFEDSNSKNIIDTAKKIEKQSKNRQEIIAKTVSFVFRHIKDKNYDHGNLTASETLEKRAGDCTEHSTLLSALLKALKIPAKMVYGIVLDPEGRFFFHNWNEVYTEKGWIVVDSTFGMINSDSARIALVYGGSDSSKREEVALAVIRFLSNDIEVSVEGFVNE
jgi:hypothetical protein